jgi:hypothetical protein
LPTLRDFAPLLGKSSWLFYLLFKGVSFLCCWKLLLLGLLILGLVLSGVAISLVFTRVIRPLHGIITLEDSSCGGPCSQIVLVVVDGLDFETVGSVGLEGGEAALCRDLEGAGFTLRKSDVDILSLAHRVEVESS